ncbi:hypothetical protein E1B28_007951 [Marasmius oreades]|uniref:Uncharacterized protein n=1 Tax=Marasmius oreades TaxID=181124 RepID=A0A9P7UVH0_9AGAR|nr:uncharacterized protein E1B28_007951 [Marasmius oreades]KAG7094351.1 hypothetical protein E1B28_007951 [Marasmius oreades]
MSSSATTGWYTGTVWSLDGRTTLIPAQPVAPTPPVSPPPSPPPVSTPPVSPPPSPPTVSSAPTPAPTVSTIRPVSTSRPSMDAIRPYLDLEAMVDDEESGSDDKDEDNEFINNDLNEDSEDAGRPIDYITINRNIGIEQSSSGNAQFNALLDKYTYASDPSPSSRTLDNINDDLNDEETAEVWFVKCKKRREQKVFDFIVDFKANHPEDTNILSAQFQYRGCGFVHVRLSDHHKAALVLRGCSYILRNTSGPAWVDMRLVTDPVEIAFCLQRIVNAITDGCDNSLLPAEIQIGSWVRLAGPKKRKRKTKNVEVDSGRKRKGKEVEQGTKKKRRRNPEGEQSDTEPEEPSLTEPDPPSMEREQSSLTETEEPEEQSLTEHERSHSNPPEEPEFIPYYTNDPAIVLGIFEGEYMVALLPRCDQHSVTPNLRRNERSQQTLCRDGAAFDGHPDELCVWGKKNTLKEYENGLLVKRFPFRLLKPLGKHPSSTEGRLFLKSGHREVLAHFPHIDDWRFDIGDVIEHAGEEGIVCDQSAAGPIVQRRDVDASDGAAFEGRFCFGWAIRKRWFIGDYVRHLSGVSGIVVSTNTETGEVTIQDMVDNLNYDFVGYTNCFRSKRRDENAVGYLTSLSRRIGDRVPSWVDAAKLGPNIIKSNQTFFRFQEDWRARLRLQRVPHDHYILTHSEATQKLKETRTGRVPWVNHEVLITGKGPLHGLQAFVVDVHIQQKTASRLKVTVESTVQGQQGARHLVDYDDVVDRHWELPLHIIERPFKFFFLPPISYTHPQMFRASTVSKTPIPPRPEPGTPRASTPRPNNDSTGDDQWAITPDEGPSSSTQDTLNQVTQTLARHANPSQAWLYNIPHTVDEEELKFKAKITGTIETKVFKDQKVDVYMIGSGSERKIVILWYNKERTIPYNAQVHPICPLVSTSGPIFILRGPEANKIVIRATNYRASDGNLRLCGFELRKDSFILSKYRVLFDQPVEFLPEDACVLSVDLWTTKR